MRKRANLMLGVAAVMYAIVFYIHLYIHTPWMEGLYWVAQSALIGGIADWFAVEALFRKPLGFPYHTALLPRKKAQLSEGIVRLVQERFVKLEKLQQVLEEEKIVPILDRYIHSEGGRAMIRQRLRELGAMVLHSKRKDEWLQLMASRVRSWGETKKITPYIQEFIISVCDGTRGEAQLTELAKYGQNFLRSSRGRAWIGSIVEGAVERKKDQSFLMQLASMFKVVDTEAITETVLRELDNELEEWQQPRSEFRLACLAAVKEQVQRLSEEEATAITLEAAYQVWLRNVSLEGILSLYVWPLVVEALEGREGSMLLAKAEELVLRGWDHIAMQDASVAELERLFQKLGNQLLPMLHEWLGKIVKVVLDGYSEEEFIRFVESKIEDDLAWIRLNGTFVGGILGFLVWGFLTFIYDALLI